MTESQFSLAAQKSLRHHKHARNQNSTFAVATFAARACGPIPLMAASLPKIRAGLVGVDACQGRGGGEEKQGTRASSRSSSSHEQAVWVSGFNRLSRSDRGQPFEDDQDPKAKVESVWSAKVRHIASDAWPHCCMHLDHFLARSRSCLFQQECDNDHPFSASLLDRTRLYPSPREQQPLYSTTSTCTG